MIKQQTAKLIILIIFVVLIIYLIYQIIKKMTKGDEHFREVLDYPKFISSLKSNDVVSKLSSEIKPTPLTTMNWFAERKITSPSERKHLPFTRDQLTKIAKRYAPMCIMHKDEEYFPSDVDWYFNYVTPTIYRSTEDDGTKNRIWLVPNEPMPEPTTILPFFKGIKPEVTPRFKSSPYKELRVQCYCFIILLESGEIQLQYYFFFPYNLGKRACVGAGALGNYKDIDQEQFRYNVFGDIAQGFKDLTKGCLGKIYRFGNHVGDWESCSVFLNSNLVPTLFHYGAHEFDYDLDWFSNELQKTDNYGRLAPSGTSKEEIYKYYTHPVVFMAYGSHGTWHKPGNHDYTPKLSGLKGAATALSGLKLIDQCNLDFESGIKWMTWKDLRVLLPEEWSGEVKIQSTANKLGIDNWVTQIFRWGTPSRGDSTAEKISGQWELEPGPPGFRGGKGSAVKWSSSTIGSASNPNPCSYFSPYDIVDDDECIKQIANQAGCGFNPMEIFLGPVVSGRPRDKLPYTKSLSELQTYIKKNIDLANVGKNLAIQNKNLNSALMNKDENIKRAFQACINPDTDKEILNMLEDYKREQQKIQNAKSRKVYEDLLENLKPGEDLTEAQYTAYAKAGGSKF